jgi:malate dehydrogenase (oxaloacetate-decarboxylating)
MVSPLDVLETTLSGIDLINDPALNKGTAFSEEERTLFSLHGLLPPHVGHLDDPASSATPSCAIYRTRTKRSSTRCW